MVLGHCNKLKSIIGNPSDQSTLIQEVLPVQLQFYGTSTTPIFFLILAYEVILHFYIYICVFFLVHLAVAMC